MRRPNILFIMSDQHRFDCIGRHGHPVVETPHLDGLAGGGVDFTNAYCPIPMCVPARNSLLCGQWPSRHGVVHNYDGETWKPLDRDTPTFVTPLKEAGYSLDHIGRWHVDSARTPIDFGFDSFVHEWGYHAWREEQGLPPVPSGHGFFGEPDPAIAPEQSRVAWTADHVIRTLKERAAGDSPFFIRWHTHEPHLPNRVPEPYASKFAPGDIPPWPGFHDTLAGKPLIQRQQRLTWNVDHWTWAEWAPIVARYLGEIALFDAQIGRVLETLKEAGLEDETLVIYTSDHGDMCGSHGMLDKHYVMYDDVMRVPLMMRWPGALPAGVECEAFVSNTVDLPFTFCRAAGAPVPESFQGMDLLPPARGTAPGRADIFASWHGNQLGNYSQRMVRNERWKYIWNAVAEDELYDLEADPAECVNRAADAACRDVLARLRGRLLEWMEQTGDRLLNLWTRDQLQSGRITPGPVSTEVST